MALDGRGDFPGTYNWITSKPRELEYGTCEEEAVETHLVVMLHAGSSDCPGNEKTYPSQG